MTVHTTNMFYACLRYSHRYIIHIWDLKWFEQCHITTEYYIYWKLNFKYKSGCLNNWANKSMWSRQTILGCGSTGLNLVKKPVQPTATRMLQKGKGDRENPPFLEPPQIGSRAVGPVVQAMMGVEGSKTRNASVSQIDHDIARKIF